ncbi:Uncharacterised protein [Zhongshania aliphaticivorans]|uniref:Uncharacterized protein n=1 Tax=Zhongshania aliphaticivorans TaxID=1470434 RepID=A0A5S9Q1Y8_9GAMM|nr:hypothetical protein [Zhongshania aliphaticivorans]CAA0110841.1 Uncharacterised protein [Zhongshania aliphaticivorans]CAA0118334.1 Uncharacterised protein [Zhongshania aliphaticivorans]CAA0122349.1 Uncharacterised protein [Zhongshania aliphaticivorans]
MSRKFFSYSALTAIFFTTPTLLCAQNIGPIQGVSNTLASLTGELVGPLQATTASLGLNSSPLFNILPGNPLLLTYDLLLKGPEEAIITGDLLQGDLIPKGVLSGLPGGDAIRTVYTENIKPSMPPIPLVDGLLDSQL